VSASAFDRRLVRTYDLRGRVGDTLSAADAHGLGLAFAAYARARGARRLAVARDGRLSSPALAASLIEGLIAGGAAVVDLGLGPTPMVHWAAREYGLDGGVMVTGSHNPADQNGFKLGLFGEAVWGEALDVLASTPGAAVPGGSLAELDAADAYAAFLAGATAGAPPLSVVWDCGHGATGPVLARTVARLPGRHRLLFAEPDGRFPAHHPDPSDPANLADLQAAVLADRADLGIAFDGDGDRIGVVGPDGRILWPDQLMLLLARGVLAAHPGTAIVADVKSSAALFDGVAALGGQAVMCPAGYVRVRAAMLGEDAPLGGEMSGHIFLRERGADDALYVAMRLLAALADVSLPAFMDALPPLVATPEIRFAARDAATVVARVAARMPGAVTVDGVRAAVDGGWWLLRASGTEDKLTARVEARDVAALTAARASLAAVLAAEGVMLPPA